MRVGETLTVVALVQRLPGVTPAAVRHHLSALHSAGLVDAVQRRPVGLWRRRPTTEGALDTLARSLGTAGDTERRRRRTERERTAWRRRNGVAQPQAPRVATLARSADRGGVGEEQRERGAQPGAAG